MIKRSIKLFVFLFFALSLWIVLYQFSILVQEPEETIVQLQRLENKLQRLEIKLQYYIKDIELFKANTSTGQEKAQFYEIKRKDKKMVWKVKHKFNITRLVNGISLMNVGAVPYFSSNVAVSLPKNKHQPLLYKLCPVNVNVSGVYDQLSFNNLDGGVWKQGFFIKTSDEEWMKSKLKVFIVPHSHNDPGWLKTMESYFYEKTGYILSNITASLINHPHRRFIWAETSFLSMWWKIASEEKRKQLRELVQNGQLEIVTGGWVMNDEANTHYFAMIDQMVEGHTWLSRHLNVTPRNGWAIDPFGYSPTMAYLLQKMKFKSMLIQRVHYAVKKYFAGKKLLEFRWRQSWSFNNQTDIVCHMMPFYFYDIPHTCGPDPKICCQFDFARLPKGKYSCPWGIPAVEVTDGNIESLSTLLLDQYRKKSKLFKSYTLLVTLGDDFRYTDANEISAQFSNYEKLIQHINANSKFNAKLQFATLDEYFDALEDDIGDFNNLPSLTGDFFTYSDKDESYWSGYYTTRPFYKKQERILEAKLRAAEIFFSLALPIARSADVLKAVYTQNLPLLATARQYLALFQHHDAITGTSKAKVVVDFGKKLILSLTATQKVLRSSAHLLLSNNPSTHLSDDVVFDFDEIYDAYDRISDKKVIKIHRHTQVNVIICNSLSHARSGLVSVFVSDPHVFLTNTDDQAMQVQINQVWSSEKLIEHKNDSFEIQFIASLPPIGFNTYYIRYDAKPMKSSFSDVVLYNLPANATSYLTDSEGLFYVTHSNHTAESYLVLESTKQRLQFSSMNGLLQSITDKEAKTTQKVLIQFMQYLSMQTSRESGGAYIFHPKGNATLLISSKETYPLRVIKGPLSSEAHALLPYIFHRVVLHQHYSLSPHFKLLHVHNLINLKGKRENLEISMRVISSISSFPYFYSDLNGFQIIKRKTYTKLPLQSNFYPMPSMAFIQDKLTRLTLLTHQPLGVSSLESGHLEILLDRKLWNDDFRGLMQGVTDNVPTAESFILLLEKWEPEHSMRWNSDLGYPSMLAHQLSWELLHPLSSMSLDSTKKSKIKSLRSSYSGLNVDSWPCDVHLVNLRSLTATESYAASDQAALILHRVGYESGLSSHRLFQASCYANGYEVAVTSLPLSEVKVTSLSLQHNKQQLNLDSNFEVGRMQIEAFKVVFDQV